jgi:hypothetical protein
MAEDMNALSALASEAGYMPNTVNRSDQSVLVSPKQNALARALLADRATEMGGSMAGMLYHGGQMVRAYVESQTANRQADESGADQFSDEKQVAFETNGVGTVTGETIIRIKDREYTAMVIEPIGENLISLTVDLA